MNAQDAAKQVLDKYPSAKTHEFRGEQTVVIELDDLRSVMEFCFKELGLNFLIDASSVDNMGEAPRFELVYELATLDDSVHLRVKAAGGWYRQQV